jgi:hypothetical protein
MSADEYKLRNSFLTVVILVLAIYAPVTVLPREQNVEMYRTKEPFDTFVYVESGYPSYFKFSLPDPNNYFMIDFDSVSSPFQFQLSYKNVANPNISAIIANPLLLLKWTTTTVLDSANISTQNEVGSLNYNVTIRFIYGSDFLGSSSHQNLTAEYWNNTGLVPFSGGVSLDTDVNTLKIIATSNDFASPEEYIVFYNPSEQVMPFPTTVPANSGTNTSSTGFQQLNTFIQVEDGHTTSSSFLMGNAMILTLTIVNPDTSFEYMIVDYREENQILQSTGKNNTGILFFDFIILSAALPDFQVQFDVQFTDQIASELPNIQFMFYKRESASWTYFSSPALVTQSGIFQEASTEQEIYQLGVTSISLVTSLNIGNSASISPQPTVTSSLSTSASVSSQTSITKSLSVQINGSFPLISSQQETLNQDNISPRILKKLDISFKKQATANLYQQQHADSTQIYNLGDNIFVNGNLSYQSFIVNTGDGENIAIEIIDPNVGFNFTIIKTNTSPNPNSILPREGLYTAFSMQFINSQNNVTMPRFDIIFRYSYNLSLLEFSEETLTFVNYNMNRWRYFMTNTIVDVVKHIVVQKSSSRTDLITSNCFIAIVYGAPVQLPEPIAPLTLNMSSNVDASQLESQYIYRLSQQELLYVYILNPSQSFDFVITQRLVNPLPDASVPRPYIMRFFDFEVLLPVFSYSVIFQYQFSRDLLRSYSPQTVTFLRGDASSSEWVTFDRLTQRNQEDYTASQLVDSSTENLGPKTTIAIVAGPYGSYPATNLPEPLPTTSVVMYMPTTSVVNPEPTVSTSVNQELPSQTLLGVFGYKYSVLEDSDSLSIRFFLSGSRYIQITVGNIKQGAFSFVMNQMLFDPYQATLPGLPLYYFSLNVTSKIPVFNGELTYHFLDAELANPRLNPLTISIVPFNSQKRQWIKQGSTQVSTANNMATLSFSSTDLLHAGVNKFVVLVKAPTASNTQAQPELIHVSKSSRISIFYPIIASPFSCLLFLLL